MRTTINDRLRALGIEKSWSAERVAKAVYEVLVAYDAETYIRGTDAERRAAAEREVFIRAPGEPRHFRDLTCWVVAYECGPYQWAISASMSDAFPALAEPYYNFDLTFYPAEWGQA